MTALFESSMHPKIEKTTKKTLNTTTVIVTNPYPSIISFTIISVVSVVFELSVLFVILTIGLVESDI